MLPQLFPYQQGKLRLHLLQVGAHGSRRVQQDAHFPLQNDSEQSAAPCSRVGGDRGQEGVRVVFATAAIKYTTPAPNLIICGSDVNLLGDSHCGIARVVTVQRQRRSVAWALGDQGFHCDFAGDDLIITFLGLSFLTLMLGD